MELLKKQVTKYSSLFFIALMMVMGIISCDCNRFDKERGKNNTGTPSISFEEDNLVGSVKTTKLKVGGVPYTPGGFNIEVKGTNGSIKIGEEELADGDMKSFNQVLGINESDKLEADKLLDVEAKPTDDKKVLNVTIILKKDGGDEVATTTLTWTPETTFEADITEDIVNGKITIEVKKDGGQVVEEDLEGLEVKFTSDQPTVGESAEIVGVGPTGTVKIDKADLKNGIVTKNFQVKKGTKATVLGISVSSNGTEVKRETVNIPAEAPYTFEFYPKKIEDGATTVQVVLKKGTDDLVKGDVEELKFKVSRTKGSVATIGGKDHNQKIALNVTLANANKEATMDLPIVPGVDKSVTWELELEDENGVTITGAKETLTWENGAKITMIVNYDVSTKKVKATITNFGKKKLDANEAKITWDTQSNDVKIGGNQVSPAPINVPAIAAGGGAAEVDLGVVTSNHLIVIAATTMKVTLTWNQLAADVEETAALEESQQVLDALKARDAAALWRDEVNIEVAYADLQGLKGAKSACGQIGEKVQKIVGIQTAIGGGAGNVAVGNALAAAKQSDTDAKTAYEGLGKRLSTDARDKAARWRDEVNIEVARADLQGLKSAKMALEELGVEGGKIYNIQYAVGGSGKIADIDNDFTTAQAAYTDAKAAYEGLGKRLSTDARDKAARWRDEVNIEVARADLQGLKSAKMALEELGVEGGKIYNIQYAVGGSGKIADIDNDFTTAQAAYTDAKAAYEGLGKRLSTDARDKAARWRDEVNIEVARADLQGLKSAKMALEELGVEGGKIYNIQYAVGGSGKIADIDNDFTTAQAAYTDAKAAYEGLGKALSTAARNEAARLRDKVTIEVAASLTYSDKTKAEVTFSALGAACQEISDIQAAVGGSGKIAAIDNDLTLARQAHENAKQTAYRKGWVWL